MNPNVISGAVSGEGMGAAGGGATHEGSGAIQRPFRFTFRRHRLLFLAVLCLLSSVVFMAAPMLRRTYELSGTMAVKPVGFEGIPELSRLAAAAVNDEAQGNVQIQLKGEAGSGQTIQIAAAAGTRDAALVQVQSAADRMAAKVRREADDLAKTYQAGLQKQGERLAAREEGLVKEVEAFRQNHRGVLPEDPASVLAQFDKLTGRLDEKQQRQRVVTEQITRLEEYKKRVAAGNLQAAPPPPVPAPAGEPGAKPASVKPADDPEVLSLTAQLQLINDQIDDQLNTQRRTEQHPYVVDLRNQQVAFQKKLEAAKQRAAAGQPPPPEVRLPVSAAGRGADPTLAAAQEVELQLQALQAEQSALDAEVRELTSQRTVMQKDVDAVMPLRREYEGLGEQLATVRKERQGLQGKVAEFEKQFGAAASLADDGANGAGRVPAVEVGPLVLASGAALPTFPRLSLVYPAGLMVGLAAALGLVGMVHRRDHYLHDYREVNAVADVPVLGVISEIRTGGQREMLRLWRSAGRPLVAVGLVLVLVGSAVVCFRSLAAPRGDGIGGVGGVLWGLESHIFVRAASEGRGEP